MTTVRLNVDEPVFDNWGEFEVRKTYNVSRGGKTEGVFGYVIQTVDKRTEATAGGKEYKTSAEISKFTTGQVLNASESYSEIFPILNGTTCYGEVTQDRGQCLDDQFQNGAILRYVEYKRKRKGRPPVSEWGADDDPPSKGKITMVGFNRFVETDEATARMIANAIVEDNPVGPVGAGAGPGTLNLSGVQWSLSEDTPANGLPYNKEYRVPEQQSQATHRVTVTWGIDGVTTVASVVDPQSGGRRKTYRKKKLRNQTRKRRQ
jgi:hypothetical protein